MRIAGLFASLVLVFTAYGLGQDSTLPPPFVRPDRGSPEYKVYDKEKKRLQALMRPLDAEYAGLFNPSRSRFEGNWSFSGTCQTFEAEGANPVIEEFSGEGYIYYYDGGSPYEGTIKIAGKLKLRGGKNQKLSGSTAKPDKHADHGADHEVEYPFGDGLTKIEIAGRSGFFGKGKKSVITFTREGDEIRFKAVSEETIGDQPVVVITVGKGVRYFNKTQGEIEEELIALNRLDQQLRYPRPQPGSYTAPSGKIHARFAPTLEYDPEGIEAELLTLIDGATETLDVCLYEIGLYRFSEALIRARDERGVKVRIVNDNHNHKPEGQMVATKLLMAAHMDRVIDDRSALMHNKYIIVDGTKLWTGSTNVTFNGIYKQDNNALQIVSPELIKEYQTEFNEMFEDKSFGPTSKANTRWSTWSDDEDVANDWVKIDDDTSAQVYFAPEDDPMGRIVDVVKQAKSSVHIMAFRFTGLDLLEVLLEKLEDPNFTVTVVLEDKPATAESTIKVVRPLLAAGATVRFDASPQFLHHKVAIVDEELVCTGSFNFSASAQKSNDENLLLLKSKVLAASFLKEQQIILAMGNPDHPEIAPYTPAPKAGASSTDPSDGLDDKVDGSGASVAPASSAPAEETPAVEETQNGPEAQTDPEPAPEDIPSEPKVNLPFGS